MPEITTPGAPDAFTQLVSGPSLTEVASTTLRAALSQQYPELTIDPDLAMVGTPTWLIEDTGVVAGPVWFESLSDVLVRLALSGTVVVYINDEHFLVEQPGRESMVQLAVAIEEIGALLNEFAPLLFTAYQEQQLAYWNQNTAAAQPRWHQLSRALQQQWNVGADNGWDEDQRAMAHAVFNRPDKTTRLPDDNYQTRACLIDLDLSEGAESVHQIILDTAVLAGTLGDRTLIITHSITQGFQCFDSFEALGQSLQWPLENDVTGMTVNWRLFEPQGNFFHHWACALIALEAQAIGEINHFQHLDNAVLQPSRAAVQSRHPMDERSDPRFAHTKRSLPRWLDTATPADQTRYSRHLLDLVAVQRQNAGSTFQGEIPGIETFTRDALERKISHQPTQSFDLQDVEITVTSVVVWGTFIPPGQEQTLTLTLIELALQNLAGLPLGEKSVRYRNGTAVPTWMTPAYLESLVTEVNIGETYPTRLKTLLFEDSAQASRLQLLYTRQLPLELPLLALQHKIRGELGIDEQGYRYVAAALAAEKIDRIVDGQEIVVRPLAFLTGKETDTRAEVVNMFVIGPRVQDTGPCLLYRPLLEPPLLQYPSTANLLYAIKHSHTLRQSVLAWLPDSVRFNYAQYVFPGALPSVWSVPQLLVDPSLSPDLAGPVRLGNRVIEEDLLQTLFRTNAQALITQADRRSVSNAEARWATCKRGGWALFNAALPFLGRSLGTAAWIWQIMDDLQEVADAQEQPQQKSQVWTAIADILLTLGMVLAHKAAMRQKPSGKMAVQREKILLPEVEKVVPAPVPFSRLPDIDGPQLPTAHELSLHTLGALNQAPANLFRVLEAFKIDPPQNLAAPSTEGPYKHLSSDGTTWYAQVDTRWFEVALSPENEVQIIDSRQQPPRVGPLLISTVRGKWFVNAGLRLRGGGLKNRREQLQKKNQEQLRQQKVSIAAFDAGLADKRLQLVNVRRAMLEATPQTADVARQQFLDTLDAQVKEYTSHIENLKALNLLEAIPNYRIAMLDRISLQLFLMQAWIDESYPTFRESLRVTLELLDENRSAPEADRSGPFEQMTDRAQGIIDKIEFAHTRFAELSLLGKEAAEVSREYKAKLPPFSLHDLKMLQITLGQELCLRAGSGETREDARKALESLIEDAALNIQSALDLTGDEGFNQLDERVEALNNLVEQFDVIDQRFIDIVAEYPQHLIIERLELIQKRVGQFHQEAVQSLSTMLREQRLLKPIAGPSKASATPIRKIIKTRYQGTLVGQPRRSEGGQESHLVDVVAPLTGKVIATFHEKSPGVWLERVPVKPPAPPKPKADLSKSLQAGQVLLDELPAFKRRTQAHIDRAQRIPTEIEEIYYLHAGRLREVMDRIDQALSAGNLTQSKGTSATTLRQQLDSEATALYAKGRTTRIEMTKQQAPTAARVQWLISEGEVTIGKATARRRLKGPRKDYLAEYEIVDKPTRKVLWYAHFHYAGLGDPIGSFTAAHLKTVDQRRLGGAYDWRETSSNQELIAIHRSTISRAQASALFFS
ncbi:dermonecrotic toxin domain-containing protein [Pseudomonas sp. NFX224]|uniref:dermonecrotic toxin domain-containing protein n=1 Tax=Pseudomonas sp. NFX224 TaxID=3402862 RepID=UPI003AFACA6F